uniref:NADH-ubiquinone oxidoreductase chain 1 n=1 Tax=Membranipora grandicella TaxID=192923 RepID=I6M195_9BILA|nr:NADH dehydrogenase subunit 1 [Membranipora grandicella]AEH99604.1 NADH dehydrogenase subunit 1 [Membranipora grandicella]
MLLIYTIIISICILLAVGFFTLLERKILGYIQYRKGPNKVGIQGLPQPLADAVKLLCKEYVQILHSNKNFFMYSPLLAMMIMLTLWSLYNSAFNFPMKYGILFFLAISSLNVYSTLMAGWASNSKYALLGAIRAVAQTISYEISMAILLICLCILSETLNLTKMSQGSLLMIIMPSLLLMWFITCLAETNRAPFDLAEGESELVSGFNIEYGGALFAFLFIAEYGSILFMSMLTSMMFFHTSMKMMEIMFPIKMLMLLTIASAFLWVRGTYPRLRYDQLMSLTWKTFLPLVLLIMMIILVM